MYSLSQRYLVLDIRYSRRTGEALNREQTATLQTALLRIEPASKVGVAAGPDTNRSAGLHSDHGAARGTPRGLVDARRRSDLS